MSKERPILFSTEMVKAIMSGRKTMTRRIAKQKPLGHGTTMVEFPIYAVKGDLLWVRETYCSSYTVDANDNEQFLYKAIKEHQSIFNIAGSLKWKPSIFMPKRAARIWLEVTDFRVESLHGISEDDAIAEGVIEYEDGTYHNYFTQKGLRSEDGVECLLAKGSFQSLWCSINGLDSWNKNPWVWAISFKVLSTTGKPINLQPQYQHARP